MTAFPVAELLRQALEAGCDLEEIEEMIRDDAGPDAPAELVKVITGDDSDLAVLAAGAARLLPWEDVSPALRQLDGDRLTPAGRTLVALCFVAAGEEPPFTLTRRDLLSGFARSLEYLSETEIENFLEEIGATPDELEEVLGDATLDCDEWGRSRAESTPLAAFRTDLSDDLAEMAAADRGEHLDTAYLLDDYLATWSDCSGPEEVTVDDLVHFAGWYLIAHTSASPRQLTGHLDRLPRIIEVVDRHYGTRLGPAWTLESDGLADEVQRALTLTELIAAGAGAPCASLDDALDGHWEVVAMARAEVRLRRLEDGTEVGPTALAPAALARLEEGDVLNLLLGRRDDAWAVIDTGPVYPARVARRFQREPTPI